VADGIGRALMALGEPRAVLMLHAARWRCYRCGRPCVAALLDADQHVDRLISRHTEASGAATGGCMCGGIRPLLSPWLIALVGDCPHLSRASSRKTRRRALSRTILTAACATPPPRRPAQRSGAHGGNGAVTVPNVEHVDLANGEMLGAFCTTSLHNARGGARVSRLIRARVPLTRSCTR